MELKSANQMLSDLLGRNSVSEGELTPERVDLFRNEVLDVLFGENRAIAKVYLSTLVSVVIVGKNQVDIHGHVSDLASGVDKACQNQTDLSVPGVHRYERR